MTSLEDFKQASNAVIFKVLALYCVLAGCVGLVAAVPPAPNALFLLVSLCAWALVGWCQFAMFNALHEGLHNRFGRPHRDFLGYLLTAYPVGFDQSYRQLHLDHHKYFGDPQRDPDYLNYHGFPCSRRQFLWRLLLNLSGIMALLQFLGIRQGDRAGSGGASLGRRLPGLLAGQAVVFAAFALTVGWFYYLWLWLLPLVTFAKFFTSTRTFCEHASPGDVPTIRTITGNFLGEKVLGVFCFHYHAEHHRYVGIPCNQLKRAHAALDKEIYREASAGEPRYESYPNGYFQLLYGWFKALPY